jgi:hypothetical protein
VECCLFWVDAKQFVCKYTGKERISDRSDISGYSPPGNSAATNLQGRDEPVTSRHAAKASCVPCTAALQRFQFNNFFTSMQNFLKCAILMKFAAGQSTAFGCTRF